LHQDVAGIHCILELHDCPCDLLDDERHVRRSVTAAARESASELLSVTSHKFMPQGVTALGLLADSHVSIHTWPEAGYAAVDIFTCGAHCTPRRACDLLADLFQAGEKRLLVVPRGRGVASASQARPSDVEMAGEGRCLDQA